jgi:hypothetical protein
MQNVLQLNTFIPVFTPKGKGWDFYGGIFD